LVFALHFRHPTGCKTLPEEKKALKNVTIGSVNGATAVTIAVPITAGAGRVAKAEPTIGASPTHVASNAAPRSPWQNGVCERLIGTVRRELLDHIIPLNQAHLECMLAEYVEYYNHVRTHQTLDGATPVKSAPLPLSSAEDTKLEAIPILGGLYHDYRKAA